MNILNWAEKQTQKMKWYHFAAVKFSVASAILLLAKFFPEILNLDWYWYAAIFVVSYAFVLAGLFSKTK